MATSRGVKQDIIDAIEAGADAYVVKPFNAEHIEEKMKELFKVSD